MDLYDSDDFDDSDDSYNETSMSSIVDDYYNYQGNLDKYNFLNYFSDIEYQHLLYSDVDKKKILYIIYYYPWNESDPIHINMFLYDDINYKFNDRFLYQQNKIINMYLNQDNNVNNIKNRYKVLKKLLKSIDITYYILLKMEHIFPNIITKYYKKGKILTDYFCLSALRHIFKESWNDQYELLEKYCNKDIFINNVKINIPHLENIDILDKILNNYSNYLTPNSWAYILYNFNYNINILNKLYISGKLNMSETLIFIKKKDVYFVKYLYYLFIFTNRLEQLYLLFDYGFQIDIYEENEYDALTYVFKTIDISCNMTCKLSSLIDPIIDLYKEKT